MGRIAGWLAPYQRATNAVQSKRGTTDVAHAQVASPPMRHFRLILPLATLMVLSGCKTPKETEPSPATPSAASSLPMAAATTEPVPSASTPPPAPIASATPAESAAPGGSAEVEEPLPDVAVKNIGMHIGGGPNDRATKQPIKESVEPYFDDLKRCWKHVSDPKKGGDFGVDLLIPREGGLAETSHPRSALKGEGFEACVIAVFQRVDFKKPKTGKTMVSYSIRFTPSS